MNKKWFVPKSYGWGLVPISWEGWLVTGLFVVIVLAFAYLNDIFSSETVSVENYLHYVLDLFLLIIALLYFCIPRTEGKVQWNWGKR